MIGAAPPRKNADTLLESYCSRLGILLEPRYSGLALLEAKQRAERAAAVANEAMLKALTADRAKSKFLANMAHELRTPLNAIIGFSEIIALDNIQKQNRYPEYAGYIHDAGSLLLDIINDILDLARIEAGKVEIRKQTVAADEVVRSAVTTIRPIAHRKSINISYSCAASGNNVDVDHVKFKQIVLNLLSNAVKFTEPNGKIRTKVDNDGVDVTIFIEDTGIGIRPEEVDKVFEPFEQIEDHLHRENHGTGLGLPIARALVELHGGKLILNSEFGVGTTAIVRLPASRSICTEPFAA